jgi:iron complex outermembrane receptor protein
MKYILFILIFFHLTIIINFGQSKIKHNLDSIVVTANRVNVSFSEVGRSINIISQKEIELLPVSTIQDLLENISGIDIKQRGPQGIQADVSIRGGTFEQTLFLIDGIKLIDPQTGHHNMNLPISFSQIERVEILKGQGSRIHGANALGGVINIIPKRNAVNNFGFDLSGGNNNYYNLGINGSLKLGITNHHISFDKVKSDGYRINTNFENYNFSLNNSFNFPSAIVKTIFGYTDKDFGANSFYTTSFPNQAEKTKTFLSAVSAEIVTGDFNLSPKIYWRKNEDEFVLNKFNPSFYKNNHETNVYGGELQASTNILGESTSFGYEFAQDQILSNNLGEHKRERHGFFIEQKMALLSNLNFSLGGYAFHYSQIDWKFWPGIDLAFTPNKNLKLFANYGRAFRIPTYTELFYTDPTTMGNSELKPEESTNYEIGLDFQFGFIRLNSSYFYKKGTNLIDYAFIESDKIWEARNINVINSDGIEFGISFKLADHFYDLIQRVKIDYTYLNSNKADLGINSRYTLEYLKHDLTLSIFHKLMYGIMQSWSINYEDRIAVDDHFIVDTKINKSFSKFNIFIKASNLFNNLYEEIPGVPLPGRWIIGGIKFSIL